MAGTGLLRRPIIVRCSEPNLTGGEYLGLDRAAHLQLDPPITLSQTRGLTLQAPFRLNSLSPLSQQRWPGNMSHRHARYFTAARGTAWLDCLYPKSDGGQQMTTRQSTAVRNLLCAFSVAASTLLVWLLEVSRIQG